MKTQLRGLLSPLAAWSLAFGCAVGWGAFVMPGTTFLPKAGPLGTVLGVVAGGLVMSVVAWNYHVMMNRNPGPGGAYAYATRAFGHDHGFICAWFLILAYVAIVWANATALALVAHYTLGDVFQFGFHYRLAGFDVWMGDILLAAAAIVAASEICFRRRLATGVQTVLSVGFALGILLCFAAAAFRHEGGLAEMAPAFSSLDDGVGPAGQILRIVALSPWLFVGFESISHASGEFGFPLRRSFRVMVAALLVSVLAYALLAVLPTLVPLDGTDWPDYIGKLGEKSGDLALPTFAAVKRALGRPGVALVGATMVGAIFTGLVGNVFAASRLLAAMADDGVLPARFGRRGADGSPQGAALAIAEISILVPFLGRTAIGFIVDVSTVGAAIAYAYASAAAWRLARGRASRISGLCGMALSAAFLVLFIVPNFASGTMMATESYLLLVLWCIIGFMLFRDVFRHDERSRFGKSSVVWLSLLVLITFMSLMWMRQMTSDTTRQAITDIERIHDKVFPDASHDADSAWDASLQEERHLIGVSLTRGSLVQTMLMLIAFVIFFNLYAILRQRERTAEREKTRARSYFFSTVSHDIRTPLNAIIGFSEMLKTGFKTEEERQQALDAIMESGKALLSLVDNILDLTRLETGRTGVVPEPTDCGRVLTGILEGFRAGSGKPGLELRAKVSGLPILLVDPHRLRQVAFNLLSNAVKFTESGFVELRASFEPREEEGAADGTLRLAVEDTGCGISEADLALITSPYVRLDAKTSRNGGTGLGLAICKNLAAAMGGSLDVASELGKGSTFTIAVPGIRLADEAARSENAPSQTGAGEGALSERAAAGETQGGGGLQTAETARSENAPSQRAAAGETQGGGGLRTAETARSENAPSPHAPKRVLIVDDSKMNLMVLKAQLKKLGDFEIVTAMDGNEALSALKDTGGEPFGLVLTDMWMPNLDGEGLVKAIRADPALAALRVIVVTADVELQGKSEEMGFDDILLKPVSAQTLSGVFSGDGAAA